MSKKNLTIIQLNDSHGYMQEHWEHFFEGDHSKYIRAGGYPRIASYLKDIGKEKEGKLLFLDGGDTFHGTYAVVETRGRILIPLLNELGLDAMTGHWDFAYGPQGLKDLQKDLNYPMLAINVYDKASGKLAFDPFLVKDIDGLKVGVIGIASNIVDKTMPPHFSKGLYFTLGKEELPGYIKELKEEKGVDLVVVLSHLGFPQEVKLAGEIPGIDLLLSAHTHNRSYEPTLVDGTIIIQSGCHGSFLGHLDIIVEDKKIVDWSHKLVVLDENIKEDSQMKRLVDKAMEPYREKLEVVLGKTRTDLNRNLVLESTMDNFLLNAIIDYAGAEIAFSNGWRYGAPIPQGDITLNDLYNIIPVNPPLSKVQLRGREIWDMLEENLERTFAKDPYEQMGGYVKRALGINMYFKIENDFGQRIQYLFVQGKPLEYDRVYEVAFVTTQGVPEKYGSQRKSLDMLAVDVLKAYLEKEKTIEAPLLNTFVAI
ncbi:MAG: bifunctional metallophosphatase/5'-nucleotidase [Tissierellia bacterium]|nr:bifunctional metallophosphatase/5'-nucleotidase [Tissierellia bacterium]